MGGRAVHGAFLRSTDWPGRGEPCFDAWRIYRTDSNRNLIDMGRYAIVPAGSNLDTMEMNETGESAVITGVVWGLWHAPIITTSER